MLAIITSDKYYVVDFLDKINYTKQTSPKSIEVYKCSYKNHEFITLVTGYGKINIGSSLRYMCDKYNITVMLVIGTAGSINKYIDIFNAIIPLDCLEFDVDFMPQGYKSAVIPNVSTAFYNTNEDLNKSLKHTCNTLGINYHCQRVASSDMFVSNYNLSNSIKKQYNAGAVDCECGNIGQFCYQNNIPFSCIKIISNFADNNSIKQYNLYEEESSNLSQKVVYKFLKLFYE